MGLFSVFALPCYISFFLHITPVGPGHSTSTQMHCQPCLYSQNMDLHALATGKKHSFGELCLGVGQTNVAGKYVIKAHTFEGNHKPAWA